jgi:hypothetical protein
MLLTLSLSLLAQAPQAPLAVPTQAPRKPAALQQGSPIVGLGEYDGGQFGTASIEAFETPVIAAGSALAISSSVLDETSLASDGQGPNLVLDSCSYNSAGGTFQWHGMGYFGAPSQTLVGFPDPTVTINYDYPQSSVGISLNAFDGFPDTATVTAYDGGGNVVDSVAGIPLPDGATQVAVSLAGSGIVRLVVTGSGAWGWSPLFDDHIYSPDPDAFEGFERATIAIGDAIGSGGPTLDDTTILTNGQGPGMVQGGVVYSSASSIQWNGQDWFGQSSQTILATTGPLVIDYEFRQNGVRFTLNAFEGFPETATVTAYDRAGNLLTTVAGIALSTDASKVPVDLTQSGIARVEVSGVNYGWSPIMDNHDYYNGPAAFEKFEMYPIGFGSATGIGVSVLDSTTVDANGNGPNLVERGVTYSSTGSMQWNGAGWFGQPSKTLMPGGTLTMDYAAQQSSVSFTLNAFDGGYADAANCYAYDTFGNLVDSVLGIALPDANQVPVTLSGLNIIQVRVEGTIQSWGALIDNHDYTTEFPMYLDIAGPCPGVNAVSITGGVPGQACRILYSTSNAGSVITTGSCTGSWTDLGVPVRILPNAFFFNAAGEVNWNRFIPANACGRIYVQVIDQNCRLSNVFAL